MTQRYQTIGAPFNRDTMYMITRDRAAVITHEALASINALRPEEQATAAALLFAVLVSRFKLDPQDHHQFGRRLLFGSDPFNKKGNSLMDALEAYAELQNTGRIAI